MMTYVEKLAREPELFVIDIATEPTFIMEQCLDWYFLITVFSQNPYLYGYISMKTVCMKQNLTQSLVSL